MAKKTEQQIRDGYQQAHTELAQALKQHCKVLGKTTRGEILIERLSKVGEDLNDQSFRSDLTGDVDWKVRLGIFDATHLGRGWEYLYTFGYGATSAWDSQTLEGILGYLRENGFTKDSATAAGSGAKALATSKLAKAGIKVVAGKIAASDLKKAREVLAAEGPDMMPNLDPLEQELSKHIGIRPKLTGKIDSKGRLLVESEDLAKDAGVLSKAFKSLKLKTFNSSYSEDKGYWMTIHWSFVMAKGGSNGIDVLTAWCKDGKWTFGD